MKVSLSQVNKDRKVLFENLLQLYMYDFTEYTGVDIEQMDYII